MLATMWPFRKKDPDPVGSFWRCFASHAAVLARGPDRRAIRDVQSHLEAVQRGLVFEIDVSGATPTLIVSADDDVRLFRAVAAVVEAAPPIPGWAVLAFRQPGPPDVAIEIPGLRLSADDLWFAIAPHGPQVDVRVFAPPFAPERHPHVTGAVRLLIDNALGELVAGLHLRSVEVVPLTAHPTSLGLRPLRELRPSVDEAVAPFRH